MLLQGPVGPFFRELQQELAKRDFDVLKVNFNGGDQFFSSRKDSCNFKGSLRDWATWLTSFVAQQEPVAIVLFGDGRPYHVEALRVAGEYGVTAWCLEEGYLRPGYITCERGGNNAHSPLRCAVEKEYLDRPRTDENVRDPFGAMAAHATLYAVAQAARAGLFRNNIRHRHRPIANEGSRWALNYIRKAMFYPNNRLILRHIEAGRLHDYFVIALQVHDDLNLLRNGNGWTMERLIDEAVRSFAQHAPAPHQLLFKVHPLDRGHRPYRRLIADAARRYGCYSRTWFVDDGPIELMIRHSNGVVTVNSTSGLLALRHGKPLLALGQTFYSNSCLKTFPPADLASLHGFWQQPSAPRPEDVRRLLDCMHGESLVRGSFYLSGLRQRTAARVAGKIQSHFEVSCVAATRAARDEQRRSLTWNEHERLAG